MLSATSRRIASSSPRPWGCFHLSMRHWFDWRVFPTPVGVFLTSLTMLEGSTGLPHARGGVSTHLINAHHFLLSSPRPWGCFFSPQDYYSHVTVFPTPVGVFPVPISRRDEFEGLPHARGGVSAGFDVYVHEWWSSPRPWGCFFSHFSNFQWCWVFPTPVGVFLHP